MPAFLRSSSERAKARQWRGSAGAAPGPSAGPGTPAAKCALLRRDARQDRLRPGIRRRHHALHASAGSSARPDQSPH
ncbi:hypothetical protein G6F40_017441 [Rhizopus arrhizus]|nr:hypothetical protein G6F40_017441 [Rhizopus arrhizus]